MSYEPETPFENIENAQEFVALLEEAIAEAIRDVEADLTQPQPARRRQAMQMVAFKLSRLAAHMGQSRRLLNDLRTLRRLLLEERGLEQRVTE